MCNLVLDLLQSYVTIIEELQGSVLEYATFFLLVSSLKRKKFGKAHPCNLTPPCAFLQAVQWADP